LIESNPLDTGIESYIYKNKTSTLTFPIQSCILGKHTRRN
jgi:hypothetical protein